MKNENWTVRKLLLWTKNFFTERQIESPLLEAQILLAHTLELERIELFVQHDRPLSDEELASFRSSIVRRARTREPLAYILGQKEFWSLNFTVTKDTLIPRPDTEILVEQTLKILEPLAKEQKSIEIVDAGTGSGAIILSLAHELKDYDIKATGIDISPEALAIAKDNALRNGLENVDFIQGNWLQGFDRQVDCVVSNPPYVTIAEMQELAPELHHEPALALVAGEDGLDVYRQLIPQGASNLKSGGVMCLEIGATQANPVTQLMREAGLIDISIHKDYAQHDRVVIGYKP